MKEEMGFWQDDLKAYHYKNETPRDVTKSNVIDKTDFSGSFYRILYIISGDYMLHLGGVTKKCKDGTLCVAEPNRRISFDRKSNRKSEYLIINIHPKLINRADGDADFGRVFNNNIDENRFFCPAEFENDYVIKTINEIIKSIYLHLDRIHMYARIMTLVSALDVYHDAENSEVFFGSNNLSVNIIQYINKHYMEEITLSKLEQRFFISSTSINAILKRSVDNTFLNYLNWVRVNEAHRMIKGNHISAKRASELCGFQTYSTFFRIFKKTYGISPSDYKRL